MKKLISLICLVLTFATLFCACNGEDPIETQPVTESTAVTTTSVPETTNTPAQETTKAPTSVEKNTFIDVDGKLSLVSKKLDFMGLPQFTQGEHLHRYAQGGVIVGDYAYTCMVTDWYHNGGVYRTCIVKTNLITGKVEAKSESLPIGTSNDAAYNPDENIIVVTDNGKNGTNKVHIIDADTLTRKRDISLQGGAQAIAYDTVNKRYICYKYNGTETVDLYIYNNKFQLLKVIPGMEKMDSPYIGKTTGKAIKFNWQGIHTDGTYLYVTEWHGGSRYDENVTIEKEVQTKLRIIDLSTGEMVDRLDLGFKREPEYIGFRKGKFYVACNNIKWSGMEFYQVTITTTKN